jgi:hypothetical protein
MADMVLSVVTGALATSLGVAHVLVDIFWWLWG